MLKVLADLHTRSDLASKSSCPEFTVCMQDEEAELLAELARIKKEREQEAAKKAAEEAAAAQSSLQQELVRGNPLIAGKFAGGNDFQASAALGAIGSNAGGLLRVSDFVATLKGQEQGTRACCRSCCRVRVIPSRPVWWC